MSDNEEWPAKWPLDPIPTKPVNRPYLYEGFKLHVEPQEFTVCGLPVNDPNYKPFFFRIKNPLDVHVEYLVKSLGSLRFNKSSEGARGILKPSEISAPIRVVNHPGEHVDMYDPNYSGPRCSKPSLDLLEMEISYCHLTPKHLPEVEKKWAAEMDKETNRLYNFHCPSNYPSELKWKLSRGWQGSFFPKVTLVPLRICLDLVLKEYEKFEEVEIQKKRMKCTIL